jgi:hypothetical protein
MPVFEVTPGEGLGPVRFGMSRDDVRATLAEPPRPFLKTPGALHKADEFAAAGLHVHYRGRAPVVEFVEAYAVEGVAVTLDGLDLLGQPATAVVEALRARTVVVREAGGAVYLLPELDVSLWRSTPADERFAAVGAAEPGYTQLAAV